MFIKNGVVDVWIVCLAGLLPGCAPADLRLAEAMRESDQRQAEQNCLIAQQNTHLAGATHDLIEADAKSRQELIASHSVLALQLQQERALLDRQREELETERRQIASARQREPMIAATIAAVGLLLACLLPLVVCIYLLRNLGSRHGDSDALSELLVQELTEAEPSLLFPATQPPVLAGPESDSAP